MFNFKLLLALTWVLGYSEAFSVPTCAQISDMSFTISQLLVDKNIAPAALRLGNEQD